jgi:hypothetical protein
VVLFLQIIAAAVAFRFDPMKSPQQFKAGLAERSTYAAHARLDKAR